MIIEYLENFFNKFETNLSNVANECERKNESLKLEIIDYLTTETNVQNEINLRREHLLKIVYNKLNSTIQHVNENLIDNNERLAFINAKADLNDYITNRLLYRNGFNLYKKIKYLNLLKRNEHKLENILDNNNHYQILNLQLVSSNKVFVYMTRNVGDDLMQVRSLDQVGGVDFSLLVQKACSKKRIFMCNFGVHLDKIMLLHKLDESLLELNLLDANLNIVSTRRLQMTCRLSDTHLISNTFEIVIDFKDKFLVLDSVDLNKESLIGQNENKDEPFYIGDKDLLYLSKTKLYFKFNEVNKLFIKVYSRLNGLLLSTIEIPFEKALNNSLDSVLINEMDANFVFKSFSTNNIILFDLNSNPNGNYLVYNKLKRLNTDEAHNYKILLRDMGHVRMENLIFFINCTSIHKIKSLFFV